jgi:acetyl esterase
VGGDSAGANLSTVLCQLLAPGGAGGAGSTHAAGGVPAPAAQLLLYPSTRHDADWPSRRAYADGFLLTAVDIDFFHRHYTGAADPGDARHTPLRGTALGGLPPALVVTAAFDPLRDEGEAYARALRDAGTPVYAWRVPGQVHGFANLTTLSPAAHAALVDTARRLADLLECR